MLSSFNHVSSPGLSYTSQKGQIIWAQTKDTHLADIKPIQHKGCTNPISFVSLGWINSPYRCDSHHCLIVRPPDTSIWVNICPISVLEQHIPDKRPSRENGHKHQYVTHKRVSPLSGLVLYSSSVLLLLHLHLQVLEAGNGVVVMFSRSHKVTLFE